MSHCIAKILGLVLRLLDPPRGRHRSGNSGPAVVAEVDPPTLLLPRGADELIRPYLLTPEEWQERREQRSQGERRRALWLASHGVDVGPRRVHGVEVAP